MATVMNALAMQNGWRRRVDTRSIGHPDSDRLEPISAAAPGGIWRRAVVIFTAGTGNPFSPPTPPRPARRAEIATPVRGTSVDGVYDADQEGRTAVTKQHS
jgi:uridylate kinase